MPNWTAMRYRFKRSRRAQLLVGMLAFALVFVVNSLIAEALRSDPPAPAPANGTATPEPGARQRVEVGVAAPRWQVGDYWVWEDGHGLRVKDTVVGTSYLGTGEHRVLMYEVERESSAMDGRKPRVENITYDSRTLAVKTVRYGERVTVDWLQRTMGLTYTSLAKGFASNATVTDGRGDVGQVYRVANVTGTSPARVRVPAGYFQDVTFVEGQYLDFDRLDPFKSRALEWAHWFSPSAGNDVAFRLTNGTLLELVGYRYSEKDAFVPPPPETIVPSWRKGATWTFEDSEGRRRQTTVVSAKDGLVTVETRMADSRAGGERATYRADDLATLNYTILGVLADVDPEGAPFVPAENSTFAYTKRVHTWQGTRVFHGNATVTVRPGPTFDTPEGDMETWRIDVVEEETSSNGEAGTIHTVRFYAPAVGFDVRVYDYLGEAWTLVDADLGNRPFRHDTLPPP